MWTDGCSSSPRDSANVGCERLRFADSRLYGQRLSDLVWGGQEDVCDDCVERVRVRALAVAFSVVVTCVWQVYSQVSLPVYFWFYYVPKYRVTHTPFVRNLVVHVAFGTAPHE